MCLILSVLISKSDFLRQNSRVQEHVTIIIIEMLEYHHKKYPSTNMYIWNEVNFDTFYFFTVHVHDMCAQKLDFHKMYMFKTFYAENISSFSLSLRSYPFIINPIIIAIN